ncbi:S8 family serine peptidase [Saccharibacillus sacchari]|uniref:S8 family serine peptidase n=1 Tax=Saccharibacillus sacchari TaxID=456493 RepID=UPI0004B6C3F7|nr:S8 family serine peptidase [Saccharibacillus sacchari]
MNKKHLSVALSSLLILPLLAQTGLTNNATAEEPDQEVVIVYKNEDGKEAALQQATEVQHEFETLPAVSATVSPEELRDLVNNPDIDYVERNIPFQITDMEAYGSTPAVNFNERSNWNYNQVAPNLMWEKGFTGQGVKVAVIDSGISPHPELTIAGGVSTIGDSPNFSADFSDGNGHGTHVAGIIAANSGNGMVSGTAPGASLYAVKALGADGKGTLQDVLEGIDWAIGQKVDIINMSLGSSQDSQALHDMVDKAYNNGIVVVASAGNSGTDANANTDTVNYPAKYSSVISVAAVDRNLQRAYFSSTGPKVDFAAPGVGIYSTYPSNLGGEYASMNGTSQAAPHIAGILAVLKEQNPSATPGVLRNNLKNYAVDLGAQGRDSLYGDGFVTFKSSTDKNAPGEVSGISLASVESDRLTLSWTPPADTDFSRVRVYEGVSKSAVNVNANSYQATGLAPDTSYQFLLAAVDMNGNESDGVWVSAKTASASSAPADPNAGGNPTSPDPSTTQPVTGVPDSQNTAPTTSPTLSDPVQQPAPAEQTPTAPAQPAPVQQVPAPQPAPPSAIQFPAAPTPAPSGGSAQIPSGGGGGGAPMPSGGGAPAPAPAPVAAAPAPSTPTVVPAKPAAPKPVASTPTPSPAPSAPSASPMPTPTAVPFSDVAKTFWARDTIAWGFERGLVKGYTDGQFKPGATVTESEFLAMLIRAFEPNVKNSTSGTWSNTYYARAKQLGLPTKGNTSKASRSQTITRAQVAEMLASANGQNVTGNQAIQYLLSAGIASGSSKASKTVASFKGSASLTRAEALQFIKNLTEKGNGSLG